MQISDNQYETSMLSDELILSHMAVMYLEIVQHQLC